MKSRGYKLAFFLLLILGTGSFMAFRASAQPGYDPQPGYNGYPDPGQQPGYNGGPGYDMPIEDFYDELMPYGQWVQTPQYGRVWIPRVEQGFQPYASNGHWVVTEYGNTWVSDYQWGWAPFHYGRWYSDPYYGWVWVPGREWAPAWVCWRSGGGYYGWAPLGPGINVSVNVNIPYNYWVFVPEVYITSPRVYSYCLPRNRAVTIINNTTIINNVYRYNNRSYFYGPRHRDLEYATRQSVPIYRSSDVYRSGRNNRGWNGDRGSYGANNGSNRNNGPDRDRSSYNPNSGNDWRTNSPSRGQSNRTGTYQEPSANTPGNGGYGNPNDNGRGRYQGQQPQAPVEAPSQPQGGVPDNSRRGGYAQQPTDRTSQAQGDYSGWGRTNRGGMYRTPSGDAAAGTGGYGSENTRERMPQRVERQRPAEAPGQPSAPSGSVPQIERPSQSHNRDWGGRIQGGQSQSQPQSQPSNDQGGGNGRGGHRGPR